MNDNSRNIKDAFESLSPSEERKGRIYRSIMNGQASKGRGRPHLGAKLAYPLIACFALMAAGAIFLGGQIPARGTPLPAPDKTQSLQSEKPPETGVLPAVTDKKAVFHGFVFTAYGAKSGSDYLGANYAEDAEKRIITPDVKILLPKYSPIMSSVPGFPFAADITDDDKAGQCADAVRVSVDSGLLNTWDRGTGVVSSEGKSAAMALDEIFYWSPIFDGEAAAAKRITITVEAVSGDTVVGRQEIYIIQDELGSYYATAGELKRMNDIF
jgi:hypothetical protein